MLFLVQHMVPSAIVPSVAMIIHVPTLLVILSAVVILLPGCTTSNAMPDYLNSFFLQLQVKVGPMFSKSPTSRVSQY